MIVDEILLTQLEDKYSNKTRPVYDFRTREFINYDVPHVSERDFNWLVSKVRELVELKKKKGEE